MRERRERGRQQELPQEDELPQDEELLPHDDELLPQEDELPPHDDELPPQEDELPPQEVAADDPSHEESVAYQDDQVVELSPALVVVAVPVPPLLDGHAPKPSPLPRPLTAVCRPRSSQARRQARLAHHRHSAGIADTATTSRMITVTISSPVLPGRAHRLTGRCPHLGRAQSRFEQAQSFSSAASGTRRGRPGRPAPTGRTRRARCR
ncbi:hypothetical protein AB0K80_33285 [Streptomyces sp. NPDC052682]|uniref:hypothetical protein n=1 Tax=Streptomyces sp. NPDC052682 TaxID=3154954 RepID=UPI003449BC7A